MGGHNVIKVNHGVVDGAAQDLVNGIKQSEAILTEFVNLVKSKAGEFADDEGTFAGEAGKFYVEKTREWDGILADLRTLGELTAKELVTANGRFAATDKSTAAMFQDMSF